MIVSYIDYCCSDKMHIAQNRQLNPSFSICSLFRFIMSHRLCWLRPVPASEVMRWLASRGDFTILCSKIKAEPRWIALEISEVQLGDEFVLYDLHAHITLCKLDEETDESLDLRHVKDIAEFLLAQLRQEYEEMKISIAPGSKFDPGDAYQSRHIFPTSPFFSALQQLKIRILCEMEVEDDRQLHLSIPGHSDLLVLAPIDQYRMLEMHRWFSAETFHLRQQ